MAEVAREVVALPEVGELLVDEVAEEAVWTEMLGVAAGVSTLFFHSLSYLIALISISGVCSRN